MFFHLNKSLSLSSEEQLKAKKKIKNCSNPGTC